MRWKKLLATRLKTFKIGRNDGERLVYGGIVQSLMSGSGGDTNEF